MGLKLLKPAAELHTCSGTAHMSPGGYGWVTLNSGDLHRANAERANAWAATTNHVRQGRVPAQNQTQVVVLELEVDQLHA